MIDPHFKWARYRDRKQTQEIPVLSPVEEAKIDKPWWKYSIIALLIGIIIGSLITQALEVFFPMTNTRSKGMRERTIFLWLAVLRVFYELRGVLIVVSGFCMGFGLIWWLS